MAVFVGSFSKSTGGAPASQSVTGVGFEPWAVIMWSGATTTTGWVADLRYSAGIFARDSGDILTSGCMAIMSEDNVGTTNTSLTTAASAFLILNTSGTTVAQASLTSMDADGFTLSWTTNDANAYEIQFMAIGGGEITDAAVVGWTLGTSTGSQAITGAGFQPDFALHIHEGGEAVHWGAMDGTNEWTCGIKLRNGQASAATYRVASNALCCSTMQSDGTVDGYNSFTSFDADGFTTNCDISHASAYQVYTLCVQGGNWSAGSFVSPVSGGTTVTGLGFEPEGVFISTTCRDSSVNGAIDAMLSTGAYDGSTNYCTIVVDDYGQDPTNTASQHITNRVYANDYNADQTISSQAYGTSLDSDGFTLAYAGHAADLITYIAMTGDLEAVVGGNAAIARIQADADARVGGNAAIVRIQADADAQVGGVVLIARMMPPPLVEVDGLSATLAVNDLTVIPGPVSIALDTLSAKVDAEDLTVFATVTVPMDTLSLASVAKDLAIDRDDVLTTPSLVVDETHAYWLLIKQFTDSQYYNYSEYLSGVIMITEPEGSEVGTMHVTLRAMGSALSLATPWADVQLWIDDAVYFGGYVVSVREAIDQNQDGDHRSYDLVVEEYETILARTEPLRRVYTGVDPGDIVADLFDYALDPSGSPPSQTEFDTSTYVTAGSWGNDETFAVIDETITEAINRLALIHGYTWRIDGSKMVHFGPASSDPAPFKITDITSADYSFTFPPLAKPALAYDGTDIRNRVTVHGGVRVESQTDNLAGDGSTLRFQLTKFPVLDIIYITVDDVLQSWGTDWYHSFDDYDVLVDYQCGTIRWDTGNAPANLAAIDVKYLYGDPITVTVHNGTGPGTSYATYGRWFDFQVVDRSITTEDLATAVAQAVVDEFEFAAISGVFSVARLGIRPGQLLPIAFPALDLDDDYVVRQVITELTIKGTQSTASPVRCDISFGNRRNSLGLRMAGTQQFGALGRSTEWREDRITRSLQSQVSKVSGSVMLATDLTKTNQPASNTNTPAGSTAYQWPIYDNDGALIGYVPVYGSAW